MFANSHYQAGNPNYTLSVKDPNDMYITLPDIPGESDGNKWQ